MKGAIRAYSTAITARWSAITRRSNHGWSGIPASLWNAPHAEPDLHGMWLF